MIKLNLLSIRFLAAAMVCGVLLAAGADAATTDPYQAAVPAADRSEAGMTAAFQSAMKSVLVRVTGRRTAAQDPALAPLIANARRYMQQYRAGTGNQIWVSFDGPALERWLAQNGQPLWGADRPVTMAWVGIPDGKGSGVIATRDQPSELRRLLDQEAAFRGIPLNWPTAADVQRIGLTYANLAQGPASAFVEPSKRLGAEGVLVGRASDAGANGSVRWTFLYQGRSSEFSGAAEGVDRAADAYAGLFAAIGQSADVGIEISGVGDLQTYAAVQTYLESLTLVSHVSVVGFDNDTMRLRLAARGGAEAVQRAIGQDSRLEPVSGATPGLLRFHARR